VKRIAISVDILYIFTNRFSDSQEMLEFYGTRRFIITFTNARYLSLCRTRSIQSMPPIPLLEDLF